MSDALKMLSDIRTLRAQARELNLESLEDLRVKLEVVVEERQGEADSAARSSRGPAKYQFTDESGETHYWSGRGRTPSLIKEAIGEGK
ncbi:H-NS family nucleoid-associated regulatory protein [Actinomycetota bacterium Odt1-20B]